MKLDLGCGAFKHPGFTGLDRRPLDGVDIVCDFGSPLPLPGDAVEFVMASRSLAYAADLPAVLAELYRICIHKAVVCILAPYAHQFRHRSNPHLRQLFDETTPRYMTNSYWEPPGSPSCPPLSPYTGDDVPYDFRLLRMELFYRAPYLPPLYEEEEREYLKDVEPNVVDEIMYHLVVAKEEIPPAELLQLSRQAFPEPLWVEGLRSAAQEPPDAPDTAEATDTLASEAPPVDHPAAGPVPGASPPLRKPRRRKAGPTGKKRQR
ncbi:MULTISPECIES: class I SAM-dependent methyltransferase [Paenibacillus]|uniref:hypothetical protein n=1 Tax=Paenibacillus TaxID=44249 RepID=UPI0022B8E242|nr:hypothetical protein [Paenibacillus caseinilyticus]MCZ8518555.1 hypothetical protein [Paenibacillus caseinilyticus]